ncbi:MAG: D-alanine--D-alanine ligase [Candidatus Magasanikbacteria bacterium]|nr:D-alanine--D-alanine ligase [Candidatus Magasanikbacteria bacterium]
MKILGIFFGGISSEYDISIISAEGVLSSVDNKKFKIIEIFIDKKGIFWTGKNVIEKVKNKNLKELEKVDLNNLAKKIDVAFPVLHGEGGEDGSIQGFLKTLKIPFVGADILASAVCLDKYIFNQLMVYNKISKPKFVGIDFLAEDKKEISRKIEKIKNKFKFPVFVKPSRAGSSIGVYKVEDKNKLESSIEKATKYDNRIVIEEAVNCAVEIEVSILGNSVKDFNISILGKIIPGADFYDYDDKYKEENAVFEIPAKLSNEQIKEIKKIALYAYKISNCQGLARVDFLMDKNNKIFLNEINTIPGFTPISMYPKLWIESGLSYKNLITKLVELAIKNYF